MELTNLTDIQEASAYIFNSWTLGLREAQLHGRNSYFDYFRDAYRVHYLHGRINAACAIGDKIFIGDEEVTLSSVADSYFDLWHYRGTWTENGRWGSSTPTEQVGGDKDTSGGGICTKPPTNGTNGTNGSDVVITTPPTVTPDDGTGDSNTGYGGDTNTTTTVVNNNFNLRAGSQAVGIGTNLIVFYLDGIVSPLPDEDYILDAYVITASGRQQRNLVIAQQLKNGFQVSDILESGTIYYQAIPRT